jgi:fructokinase
MPKVLVIGEAFVDFLPRQTGSIKQVDGFEMHGGGAPCNVARGVSKLGIDAAFISVLGVDEFSDFIINQLDGDGVNIDYLRRLEGGRTQLCFVTLDDRGDRQFTGRGPDASLSFGVQDIKPAAFADSRVLMLSCGSLRTRQGVYAVERGIQLSPGWVCCDPGTCPPEWCDPQLMRRRLWGVFTRCELVKCADHETFWLTGEDDPLKAAQAFIKGGAKCAIVTLGAEGALWARNGEHGRVPSADVDVLDTTGAGDAFMSGLIALLSTKPVAPSQLPTEEWVKLVRFASYIGALAVTQLGAVHGIPKLENQEMLVELSLSSND